MPAWDEGICRQRIVGGRETVRRNTNKTIAMFSSLEKKLGDGHEVFFYIIELLENFSLEQKKIG